MFKDWLTAQMKERHWGDSDVATMVKVSPGAVWSWRTGRNIPTLHHIEPIAKAFGVREIELFIIVRNLPEEELRDYRLMRLLGLKGGEREDYIRLAGMFLPVLDSWMHDIAARMAPARTGEDVEPTVVDQPVGQMLADWAIGVNARKQAEPAPDTSADHWSEASGQ